MVEILSLENCGPFSFNYNAHSLCTILAGAYTYHIMAYIGGGDAADRLVLRNALLSELQESSADVVSKEMHEFIDEFIASVRGGNSAEFLEKYASVPVLLLNDIEQLAGKDASQEHFYNLLKTRYDRGLLTVVFSGISYDSAATYFTTPLYDLLGADNIAELGRPNAGELFFFENDYGQMLHDTFLVQSLPADAEEDGKKLEAFLFETARYHIDAAAWYLLLTAAGSCKYFSSTKAMRVMHFYDSFELMASYKDLLQIYVKDTALVTKYTRAPFIWAVEEANLHT